MNRLHVLLGCLIFISVGASAAAQELLPGDRQPLLQLQTTEPTAPVTALGFGWNGERAQRKLVLYAGGYDKVVHSWVRGEGKFEPAKTYRLPIGPGIQGTINSVAVSPDGRWLAAAGNSVVRDASGFFDVGIVEPRLGLSDPMLKDQGTIYLFDTRTDKVRLLRGHRGTVLTLAFAPARPGKPSLLVSVGREVAGKRQACVLRLWNAEKGGDSLANSPDLPDPVNGRPGLAIWHTGNAPRQVCAAVACDRQPLRVWNATGEPAVTTVGDKLFINEPAAFWPEGDRADKGILFSCGTTSERLTRLFAWQVDGAAAVEADAERTAVLPKPSLSYALTLLPAHPGGSLSRAAFVQCLRKDADPNHHDYALLLRGMGAKGALNEQEAYFYLWQGGARPALAAAPDGRHLAVGGGPANEVRIYTIADLTRKEPKASQSFRSPGVIFSRANFVRKGQARGLRLKRDDDKNPWPDGLIFDVKERRLTVKPKGWENDIPDLQKDKWSLFDPDDAAKKSHGGVVGRAGERIGQVVLKADQTWTAWALLPPGTHKIPLLAIAYVEKGVPYLGLWNVIGGHQVRQFTGHLSPIRRVAFDAAGQRLISVADDQTVCVWNVGDLEQTLGKHGMIRGLALKDEKGLRIADLDKSSLNEPNRAALRDVKAEDIVTGLVIDDKVQSFKTPHAFYQAIWKLKPSAPAVLRIADRGDISLQVDQGVDDYKPLFSLFVTRDRQWVGWSPEGPYDTGNPEFGKNHIGWHRNTGKADAPASFDAVGLFHKQFYRDRILHYLLKNGNVADALLDWKKEAQGNRPHTNLWIADLNPRGLVDPNRPAIAQREKLLLQAEVSGIHPDRVEKVEWRVFRRDGERAIALGPPVLFDGTQGTLKVDLRKQKLDWQRGVHEVRASVTLSEDRSQPLTESIWFHYLPQPPAIEFSKEWIKAAFGAEKVPERHVCSQKTFHLDARINLDRTVGGAHVLIRHNGRVKQEGADLHIKTDLELNKGINEVEIVAINKGADDPELRKYESATRRFLLDYAPDQSPPQIHVLSVTPGDEVLPRPKQREWIVTSPRVRIRGEISAAANLTVATFGLNDEKAQPFKDFKAGRERTLPFDEMVDLKKAGRVPLTIQASTKDRKADPQTILLVYLPPLPSFRLDSPRIVEANVKETDLLGHLTPAANPYPYRVTKVLLKDRETAYELDAPSGELKIRTALQPGTNRLEIHLTNGHRSAKEQIDVYRKQPPTVSLKRIDSPDAKAASFEAVVRMSSSLTLKTVRFARIKVDNRPVSDDEQNLLNAPWKRVERDGGATWTLVIKDVPVRMGVNTFELKVANEDGSAVVESNAQGEKPLPPPPEISFDPLPPGKVFEPRCPLSLRVRSSVPLRGLKLLRNGKEVAHPGLLKPDASERPPIYLYTIEELPLEPGTNVLVAEASNAGGSGKLAKTNVTYVQPTAAFHLEGYKLAERADGLRSPTRPSSASRVELYGSLHGNANLFRKGTTSARVWVNDFEQHGDLRILKAEEGVWRFALPLSLNRETNRIKLRFSEEVILKDGDFAECVLHCENPEKRQRLHLLIVAPGKQDIGELTAGVLAALGAKDIDGDRFRTDAFSGGGRVYGPTRGDDNPDEIHGFLHEIRDTLGEGSGEFNDVVIVYFRGEMRRIKDKRYLLMWSRDNKEPLRKRALDCDRVREDLSSVLGAKLLLLDVQGKPEAAGSVADASGLIGDFQYIWLGQANDPKRRYLLKDLQDSLNSKRLRWGVVKKQLTKDPGASLRVDGLSPEGYNDIPLKSAQD